MNKIKIQSFGGQIIGAKILGHELFYCPDILHQPPIPTRAGIPILFPQFSNQGPLIKHGIARLKNWQISTSKDEHTLSQLLITEQQDWPHRAQLQVETCIKNNCINIQFSVHNVGNSTFEWTGGLHPYFLVDDVMSVSILGLTEQVLHMNTLNLPQKAHDMPYPATKQPINLNAPSFKLKLEQKGFSHWMLWNPGAKHQLTDIPHNDWSRFICIEPVCLSAIKLKSNEAWTGLLKITLTLA